MRILVFHGYLLEGTGSNVYNARLAEALARLGHEVHLLSQDRHAEEEPFVDAVGDWDDGRLRVRRLDRAGSGRPGSCTVYRPNIGALLPVYVADRYEGIEARTFSQCSEDLSGSHSHHPGSPSTQARERARSPFMPPATMVFSAAAIRASRKFARRLNVLLIFTT